MPTLSYHFLKVMSDTVVLPLSINSLKDDQENLSSTMPPAQIGPTNSSQSAQKKLIHIKYLMME